MMHKKARKQFAEDKQTKDMDYWNHVLWSDETKINLFGSDGVKHDCLVYSQSWWWECHGLGVHECCRHWGATIQEGTINANMYCYILKQSMIPSFRRLGCSIPT